VTFGARSEDVSSPPHGTHPLCCRQRGRERREMQLGWAPLLAPDLSKNCIQSTDFSESLKNSHENVPNGNRVA
jgi:hypothetical protein